MCLGSWLAFGRLNRVLGLDEACVLPSTTTRALRQLRLDPETPIADCTGSAPESEPGTS